MTALVGLFIALVLALALVHRELLRRAFLRAEDPRTLGALRIAFTAVALLGVLEPLVDAHWWFSDEGLLLREAAQAHLPADTLSGFHAGRFHDLTALWNYLSDGTATPLHFLDTPAFVSLWAVALLLALLGLLLGWRTRTCAWIVVVLYLGLLRRNSMWCGGEQVYCAGFVLLAMSRCGHAYSLDNWLRCRALRGRGKLSEPGGPGDGAGTATLAAIYRRIPAWPRLLVIAQVAVAYGVNGLNKDGKGWWNGTGLFYILQGDWARLDARPLAQWLGTDALHWATVSVRAWETLFPLVVLGLVLRFAARERLPAPRAARWLWPLLGLVAALLLVAFAARHPRLEAPIDLTIELAWALTLAGVLALSLLRARILATPARWLFARRVWLTGAVLVTAGLYLTLNVGVFPLATLTLTLAMFRGEELARLFAHLRGHPPIPCEDGSLAHLHHDDASFPARPLALITALLLLGAAANLLGAPAWTWRWVVLAAALLLLHLGRPARPVREDSSRGPWAYGPLGRLLIGSLCAVHLTALALNTVPNWPQLADLRDELRRPTAWWLDFSGMYQYWEMFAGTSTHNLALVTRVIDADGHEHTTVRRQPHDDIALWNWRQTKLDANTVQRKHGTTHARAVCRRFAREHAGRTPRQVSFYKRTANILPPWQPADPDRLARFTATATTTELIMIDCRTEPHAQLPDHQRARLGLPPLDTPFIPLPERPDRPTRDHGPAWPYDEWLALLAITALLLRWRPPSPRRPAPINHRAERTPECTSR